MYAPLEHPSYTPADLAAHIEALCQEHGIVVYSRASSGGRAWRRSRRISIRPVRSGVTYAVALHEIGHILSRQPKTRLDREAAAWEWARAASLEWTPRMQACMQRSLDSYARWFARKRLRGANVAGSDAFDRLRGDRAATTALKPWPK